MSNAGGFLRSRLQRSPGTARLAAGDLLLLVGLFVLGQLRHGINPVESPLVFADTFTPFLFGWVVAALVAGAYGPGATRTVRSAVLRVAPAWVAAAAIGLALRATPYFHGSSPLAFALVVTGTGVLALSAWRATVAYLQ